MVGSVNGGGWGWEIVDDEDEDDDVWPQVMVIELDRKRVDMLILTGC